MTRPILLFRVSKLSHERICIHENSRLPWQYGDSQCAATEAKMPDTEQTEHTLSKDDEGPYIEQTNDKKSTKAKSHTLESDLLAKHIRIWLFYLHDNYTGMNTGQKILFLKRKAEANLEQLMEDRGPLYSLKGEEFYESIYSSQDIDLYERMVSSASLYNDIILY